MAKASLANVISYQLITFHNARKFTFNSKNWRAEAHEILLLKPTKEREEKTHYINILHNDLFNTRCLSGESTRKKCTKIKKNWQTLSGRAKTYFLHTGFKLFHIRSPHLTYVCHLSIWTYLAVITKSYFVGIKKLAINDSKKLMKQVFMLSTRWADAKL